MKENKKKTIKKLLANISASSQNTTSSCVIIYHPKVPKITTNKNDK